MNQADYESEKKRLKVVKEQKGVVLDFTRIMIWWIPDAWAKRAYSKAVHDYTIARDKLNDLFGVGRKLFAKQKAAKLPLWWRTNACLF